MIHIVYQFHRPVRSIISLILHRLPSRLHRICGGTCEIVEDDDESFRFAVHSPRRELSSHGTIRVNGDKLEIDVIPAARTVEHFEELIRQAIDDEVLPVIS